ncbi:MAG TPA: hypothetical protein DCE41_22920 [Cytophagales bacterium]|nr:hypothetical protein [Cytophagales bacterium]
MSEDMDEWPQKESMKGGKQFYNGKVHYGLLVRFLRTRVGENWDQIYHEVRERIPSDLLQHQQWVEWFVVVKVERRPEGLLDLRHQKYLITDTSQEHEFSTYRYSEFYVDPDTNLLVRVADRPSQRATKGMDAAELRAYRKEEEQERLGYLRSKKEAEQRSQEWVEFTLKKHNEKD